MTRFFMMGCIVCFSSLLHAQSNTASTLNPTTTLLFKNVKSKTTDAEKNFIAQQSGLKLAADKQSFVMDEFPVEAEIYPTDMNSDGKEEIFLVLNSTSLFGMTGTKFILYMKNAAGKYQAEQEVGGGMATILPTKNLGYPDILIGMPGMTFPIYRWNGKTYKMYRSMKNAEAEKTKLTDIQEYSKKYTGSL